MPIINLSIFKNPAFYQAARHNLLIFKNPAFYQDCSRIPWGSWIPRLSRKPQRNSGLFIIDTAGFQGKISNPRLSQEQLPRTSKDKNSGKWMRWETGIFQLIKISVLTKPQIILPSFSVFFL